MTQASPHPTLLPTAPDPSVTSQSRHTLAFIYSKNKWRAATVGQAEGILGDE